MKSQYIFCNKARKLELIMEHAAALIHTMKNLTYTAKFSDSY